MELSRLNQYQVMWLMVFFDLPTKRKKDQRIASAFRKTLMSDGFQMFQFSIYIRHCPSRENAEVHRKRVKQMIPKFGHVGILQITDKQFGMMEIFYGEKKVEKEIGCYQLEMF